MTPDWAIAGKVAIVTGGSRGLGHAMARALAHEGAHVVITSREQERAEAALKQIVEGAPADGLAVGVEMRDREGLRRLVDATVARFGGVDILVNNAGINVHGTVEQLLDPDWDAVMDVNVTAPFLLTKACVPSMRARGGGRVVNVSSIFGLTTMERRTAYTASKAALLGLTKTLAVDLAPDRITVNALCPGPFRTDMTDRLVTGDARRYFEGRIPLGRYGEPEELVGPFLLLVSPMGSFMTGAVVTVDGGWTAGEAPSRQGKSP